jgi:hypothetical protein
MHVLGYYKYMSTDIPKHYVPPKKVLSAGQPGIWDSDTPVNYTADYLTTLTHSLLK